MVGRLAELARREWRGRIARVTTKLSLRRVGLELPQALAVESVRPQAHAIDSTHSVRSLLFNYFETKSELGKINAPEFDLSAFCRLFFWRRGAPTMHFAFLFAGFRPLGRPQGAEFCCGE